VAIDCEQELSEYGLLAGYYKRLTKNEPIDMSSFLETIFVLNEISLIVSLFSKEFGFTKLIEY
jgi:hypothetical protein